jgi:hypothetical protein
MSKYNKNIIGRYFRFSRLDNTKLRELANITGQSESEVIRSLIHGEKLRPRPPNEYPYLLHELNAIGNNINQIAHAVNSRKRVEQRDVDRCIEMLGAAYDLIDKRLFGEDTKNGDGEDNNDTS